jgi:hypothetical protein
LVREPKGFLTIPAHGGGSKLAPPLEGLNMNTKTFVNNIFIAGMLTTALVGYDVAHTKPAPMIVYAEAPKEVLEVTTQSVEPTVEEYIYEIFGDRAEDGIRMLKECENKLMNPEAINWNGNGTYDFGLWQINSIHGYTKEQLKDYKFNTRIAYKIFKNAGYSFSPWTCAEVAGDHPFWK